MNYLSDKKLSHPSIYHPWMARFSLKNARVNVMLLLHLLLTFGIDKSTMKAIPTGGDHIKSYISW